MLQSMGLQRVRHNRTEGLIVYLYKFVCCMYIYVCVCVFYG